jgi:hypothetical protein
MQERLFVASVVYEVNLSKSGKQLLEEQVLLISAMNKEEAQIKAIEIAESNTGVEETLEEGYQIWKFKLIQYLIPVENHLDGQPFITRTMKSENYREQKTSFIPEIQLN